MVLGALVFTSLAIVAVQCVDRGRLARVPEPQKQFAIDKYVGDWYLQARLVPCSWSGSALFSDFITQFKLEPNRNVLLTDNFRSTSCVQLTYVMTPQERSGVYKVKDPVGDLVSGDCVVVATDYKHLSVEWGCTKTSVAGTCSDSYVVVKTRAREPTQQTWKTIEAILQKLWALSLTEMQRISHDNGCVQIPETNTRNDRYKIY